ncbi:DMT family transporter [Neobacillus sp. PS3-12]|uniref:DMT family transporter n=1 Tax=Neobacillus sp. PS3-12 TaxID=3070677 RepID=UPI0027E0C8DA|nr:DMT family transporter [Neobacillus sp. PS3-12]WML51144.1 DMT family transporter [Neobacillus sp. PS3-12]
MFDHKKFTNAKFVAAIATLCCLLWGSAYPAIKIGYILFNINTNDIASKFLFAGYRFVIAGVILLTLAQLSGKRIFSFSKRNFSRLFTLGVIQTTLQYIFFYIGVANTTGVKGSVMNSTAVFFGVILAHYIYKDDKLTKTKAIGCMIGFIGVIAVNFNSELLRFSFNFIGDGFVIIAALIFSVAVIYSKKLTESMDVMVITGYSLFIGGIILVLLGEVSGGQVDHFTLKSSFLLIYLALLSSIAFSLWNLLLKYNNVGLVSVYNFLTPIFGSVLSAIFLGETIFELKNIVALILVCIGIWMVNAVEKNVNVLLNEKLKKEFKV